MKIFFRYFFIFLFLFGTVLNVAFGQGLSEQQAFVILFGNYDSVYKHAIWKNMKLPTKGVDDFWKQKTGIASSVLFQSYTENGKNKFFFLTKTIPADIPFECHACLPLLSATVFSLDKGEWKIESQNPFLMYESEYGEAPAAKLISVGKDKAGVSLEFEHHDDGVRKSIAIIIPYKKSVVNAYQGIMSYENSSVCDRYLPCAAFATHLQFDKLKSNEFYQLIVERVRTNNDEKKAYKAVSVNAKLSYRFVDGKYVKIF